MIAVADESKTTRQYVPRYLGVTPAMLEAMPPSYRVMFVEVERVLVRTNMALSASKAVLTEWFVANSAIKDRLERLRDEVGLFEQVQCDHLGTCPETCPNHMVYENLLAAIAELSPKIEVHTAVLAELKRNATALEHSVSQMLGNLARLERDLA